MLFLAMAFEPKMAIAAIVAVVARRSYYGRDLCTGGL
jgi:hypothetical protein